VDASEFTEYRPLMFSITTRLAIDHLRSARVRRESYVGDLAARARLQAIAAVANPAKLRHLGPILHSWHLRWRADDYENRSVTPRPAAAS
jgi:DNA-directed RNA polymerase specialized sigma24 family protein